MAKDKYSATWASYSSIKDFLQCPYAYYLKNVYKDPKTGHKIQLMKPALALGQAVHEVLESLSKLKTEERFKEPLPRRLENVWQKVSGKQGGFVSEQDEQKHKNRAKKMLANVYNNPGPLKNLAIKIREDLPYFWLSEEDNIILCGKVDWLEYNSDNDTVNILDFKTGKKKSADPLQLDIYLLLVKNCQNKEVSKAGFWYLEQDTQPVEAPLPDPQKAMEEILAIAKKMKLARQLEKYDCPNGEDGCMYCRPYQRLLKGEGELIGIDDYNRDIYILPDKSADTDDEAFDIL